MSAPKNCCGSWLSLTRRTRGKSFGRKSSVSNRDQNQNLYHGGHGGSRRKTARLWYAVRMATATPIHNLRLNQITGKIISGAMQVHSLLGRLLESTYQACLQHELTKR